MNSLLDRLERGVDEGVTVRVYVAGPITGHDQTERRRAFKKASTYLKKWGAIPYDPFELHAANLPWAVCMRADIKGLVECDAIMLLPGWEKSKGVALELHIAQALGMEVWYYER